MKCVKTVLHKLVQTKIKQAYEKELAISVFEKDGKLVLILQEYRNKKEIKQYW